MRAAALVIALSVSACFPHNARHRTYAKLGEGAAIASGIAILSFAGTGADCDQMRTPGLPDDGCDTTASVVSTVGLGLILAGMVGFIATVSTSPDDQPNAPAPRVTPTLARTPAPATK